MSDEEIWYCNHAMSSLGVSCLLCVLLLNIRDKRWIKAIISLTYYYHDLSLFCYGFLAFIAWVVYSLANFI